MSKIAASAKLFAPRAALAAALVAGVVAVGSAPAEAAYVKAGVLTCTVSPSVGFLVVQRKDMTCTFAPSKGATERYAGTLRKYGIAVGATGGGVIVWGVLSGVTGVARGALAGDYAGASAEASVVVGAGANVLVGGSNRSFALQPVSVEGQIGLDFAVGISELTLVSTR